MVSVVPWDPTLKHNNIQWTWPLTTKATTLPRHQQVVRCYAVDYVAALCRAVPRSLISSRLVSYWCVMVSNVNRNMHTTNGERRTTNDDERATNDQRPTTNDQRPTTNGRPTRDPRPTTNDQRPTTNDQRPTTNDQRRRHNDDDTTTTTQRRRHNDSTASTMMLWYLCSSQQKSTGSTAPRHGHVITAASSLRTGWLIQCVDHGACARWLLGFCG